MREKIRGSYIREREDKRERDKTEASYMYARGYELLLCHPLLYCVYVCAYVHVCACV